MDKEFLKLIENKDKNLMKSIKELSEIESNINNVIYKMIKLLKKNDIFYKNIDCYIIDFDNMNDIIDFEMKIYKKNEQNNIKGHMFNVGKLLCNLNVKKENIELYRNLRREFYDLFDNYIKLRKEIVNKYENYIIKGLKELRKQYFRDLSKKYDENKKNKKRKLEE